MANIVSSLQNVFEQYADTDYAPQMEAYMKHHFPFYGIKSPLRKSIQKTFVKEMQSMEPTEFKNLTKTIWKKEEREWQYTAVDSMIKYIPKMDITFIPLTESLIVSKSWWDTVDFLAGTILGKLLLKFPEQKLESIDRCINSGDMWLERSALLHQLKYQHLTDPDLMSALIEIKKNDKAFFIQKAIGWSLRQYSKLNPLKVMEILTAHPELSNLAKREASKYLEK